MMTFVDDLYISLRYFKLSNKPQGDSKYLNGLSIFLAYAMRIFI